MFILTDCSVWLLDSRLLAGSLALCESEAAATKVLSVRKRSGSNKGFICAKAKRQQQRFYLCESEAAATMFYLCESEAAATKRVAHSGNQSLLNNQGG